MRFDTITPGRLAALALLAIAFPGVTRAQPPVPGSPVASCVTSGSDCFVGASFTLTASSAGAHHYRFCRSVDTLGFGGCDQVMTWNSGATYTVTGTDLPSDGQRRAYYAGACDVSDNCTNWGGVTYVMRDATAPSAPGATTVSCSSVPGATVCWVPGPTFGMSVSAATDSGSGVDTGGYWICRSNDSTGGYVGCQTTMTTTGTTSTTVSGANLPSSGFERAYYFQAKDKVGNASAWNTPLWVRVDSSAPTVSATNASLDWFLSRSATVSAGDAVGGATPNSGLHSVRYRWNTAHDSGCTTGTATSHSAVLTVPAGDNTLYLCAKDYTGNVTQWNGKYRVATNYGLSATELLPYTFGCPEFCDDCDHGFGYAYDPSVISRSGNLEIFAQGATLSCGTGATDVIVEGEFDHIGSDWFGDRLGEVSSNGASGCTSVKDPPLNASAGPDVLMNSNSAGNRILFHSRGNADSVRGKIVSAYESGGGWNPQEDHFLLYPLCFNETTPTGTEACTKIGVSRVAAIELGSYYYLYFEMEINSANLPSPPTPSFLRVGIFLMRVPKKATAPYVEFGANQAELYNASAGTWHTLPFQSSAPYGYSANFCDGLITTSTFDSWRLQLGSGGHVLGDVTLAPSGEYIITYEVVAGPAEEVKFKRSTDPTFSSGVSGGAIDLSGITASVVGTHYSSLYPVAGTGEFILFFSNFATNHGISEVRSARVQVTLP